MSMQLLYVADPMCSWCYGFGPELSKLVAEHPGAQVEVVMGGLRPFNREPMSPAFRDMLREHWKHVHEASGLPFDETRLASEGFVYDTEPACRAVVTARSMVAALALPYFKAVQEAFYRDGRDVTRPEVLADIAAERGFGRAAFLAQVESQAMLDEVRVDFSTAQSIGATGFPTLGIAHGRQLYLVTSGFVTADVLASRIAQISRLAHDGTSPGEPGR